MSLVLKRKSIRKYTNKVIEDEKIQELLKAAMQAPSANNQQPWEFIVVDDQALLTKLSEASPGAWMLKNVTKAIVVVMKETEKSPVMAPQDCATATQNILLRATELGLGGVWIGVYPKQERYTYIEAQLKITKGHAFSMIALGYPDADETVTLRYDKSRVHTNHYQE
ncbi:MAG: nitroreductase family protein [Candidatus Izimaplasma sp.]|nr:nitroreductase family protein [Candidatus Izimaplasma bacterium]